jgi:enoyl-[acyl-carrier protein] reductase III
MGTNHQSEEGNIAGAPGRSSRILALDGRPRPETYDLSLANNHQRSMGQTLAGRVALVTGGARGIGRATALKLASAGCDIAVNYYNSHAEATDLCEQVRGLGREAIAIQGSVGDPDSVKDMFASLKETFDRLDILVSNAASGVLKPAMQMNRKHWRWCMETNALALLMLSQEAVKLMPEGGRIIALSSLGASRAIPDYAFVGASKAALESMVRSLAQELGPQGIRVNTISAGVVDTDALSHFPNRETLLENFSQRNPTGKSMVPEHVADAAYLLCLPEAEMINGQTLIVDGGFAISG